MMVVKASSWRRALIGGQRSLKALCSSLYRKKVKKKIEQI